MASGSPVGASRFSVKLVARAFYDEEIPPRGPSKSKVERAENRGIAVVILDALSRRQWMKEEELARQLHLHPKQLRRTLKALEEDLLVVREHRKENVRTLKRYNQAIAVMSDGKDDEEEKLKVHTHSYCALNYAQIYDVIRYRIHRAKKKIKDELEDRNTVQEYVCPNTICNLRFSALDAMALINPVTQNFHCERCSTELVIESERMGLNADQAGNVNKEESEENMHRRRRDNFRALYAKIETQLKPLQEQILKVKELTPPNYGSLAEWEMKASNAQRAMAMGETSAFNLPAKRVGDSMLNPMPSVGETKVVVNIGEGETAKEATAGKKPAAQKIIPAWAIREGMNLTAAQRGEKVEEEKKEEDVKIRVKQEAEASAADDDEQARLQAYYAAYYAALQQQQASVSDPMMKSEPKEEIGVPEGEEVEWEEDKGEAKEDVGGGFATAITGNELDEENYEWEGEESKADGNPDDKGALYKAADTEKVQDTEYGDDFEWDDD